jgi:histidinol-phosphate aminotransferase
VVAEPQLAGYIDRIRAPYNVNAAAVVAALATLSGLDPVRATIAQLVDERERIRRSLNVFSWIEALPSQANFILCRVRGRSGQWVADALAREGILVQAFPAPVLRSCVRITIGRPEQNNAMLRALGSLPVEPGGPES